ncbi:MAG: hypothetical protein ACK5D8_04855 [Bacteroidota bacterium]
MTTKKTIKHLLAALFIYQLFMLYPSLLRAQNGETRTDNVRYEYCELVGRQKFLSTKVVVSVDYGEARGFFQDTRVRNEVTGKVQSFNSMIDALNYLGESGWEFVQAYTLTNQEQNIYRWLLKKRK